jgi:maltoporin
MRAGAGGNGQKGDQVCFQDPGARAKYRLGNECEDYAEIAFRESLFKGENNAYFDVQFLWAYVVSGEQDFEQFDPAMRETYVEAGNLFGGLLEGVKFWAGKRFYRRHDVHINDFFYWDNSGPGAGFEDLDLGFGKLAYAYRPNTNDDMSDYSVSADSTGDGVDDTRITITGDTFNVTDNQVISNDIRLYDVGVNPGGTMTFGVDWRIANESQQDFNANNGLWLNVLHFQDDVWGGFNKLALQYARGAASQMVSASDDSLGSSVDTYRIVETLMVQPTENFSAMGVIVYEQDNGNPDRDEWFSIGARPKYYFNDYFDVSVELGYDQVNPPVGGVRKLFKATIAPELSAGKGFFARPTLRAFVTYANWNDAASENGVVLNDDSQVFGSNDHGVTYGFQAEAWW